MLNTTEGITYSGMHGLKLRAEPCLCRRFRCARGKLGRRDLVRLLSVFYWEKTMSKNGHFRACLRTKNPHSRLPNELSEKFEFYV